MKKTNLFTLVLFVSLWLSQSVKAQTFDYDNIAPHPRLVLRAGDETAVKVAISKYKPFQRIDNDIFDYCDSLLNEPPVWYNKEGRRILVTTSQKAKKRIIALSYAYRMSGKKKYAKRAALEIETVCDFKDWNPSHFLDVGEMSVGVALGYDWLYDYLSVEQKQKIEESLTNKVMKLHRQFGSDNWNSVCQAGIIYAALAIYESNPAFAKTILEKSVKNNHLATSCYGPDGGYPEGYTYWNFGTSSQVMICAGLESALGNDNGLSAAPGFLKSAYFMEYMAGPSGNNFNFSDGDEILTTNLITFWFADKLNDPSVAWLEKQSLERGDNVFSTPNLIPISLIFASRIDMSRVTPPSNNFWLNRGETHVFAFRQGWNSTDDAYLGVKGGSTNAGHSHLDFGSFVYDKNGVRWAMDLGKSDYNIIEQQGVNLWGRDQNSDRWQVFRLSNRAHNTLWVDNQDQLVRTMAPIIESFESDNKKGARIDLSAIYCNTLNGAVRDVYLNENNDLTVEDRLVGDEEPSDIMWIMTTSAKAKIISDNTIELSKNGQTMFLVVDTPNNCEMQIWDNTPANDYEERNDGTCRVGFVTKIPAIKHTTLRVKIQDRR